MRTQALLAEFLHHLTTVEMPFLMMHSNVGDSNLKYLTYFHPNTVTFPRKNDGNP